MTTFSISLTIQKVYYDWMTVWGPNHRWTDSYPIIGIELIHGTPSKIHVQYDPYKVLHHLKEKMTHIAEKTAIMKMANNSMNIGG